MSKVGDGQTLGIHNQSRDAWVMNRDKPGILSRTVNGGRSLRFRKDTGSKSSFKYFQVESIYTLDAISFKPCLNPSLLLPMLRLFKLCP
jgi:hypothetical protein